MQTRTTRWEAGRHRSLRRTNVWKVGVSGGNGSERQTADASGGALPVSLLSISRQYILLVHGTIHVPSAIPPPMPRNASPPSPAEKWRSLTNTMGYD